MVKRTDRPSPGPKGRQNELPFKVPLFPATSERSPDGIHRPPRLLTLREVMEMTGLSKSCIYDLRKRGRFPQPVRVTDHAVRWILEEVLAFIASRPRAGSNRSARK